MDQKTAQEFMSQVEEAFRYDDMQMAEFKYSLAMSLSLRTPPAITAQPVIVNP